MSVYKPKNEIPTIDWELVTVEYVVTPASGNDPAVTKEIGFTTANSIAVEVQTETQDAVKLIINGPVIAGTGNSGYALDIIVVRNRLQNAFSIVGRSSKLHFIRIVYGDASCCRTEADRRIRFIDMDGCST